MPAANTCCPRGSAYSDAERPRDSPLTIAAGRPERPQSRSALIEAGAGPSSCSIRKPGASTGGQMAAGRIGPSVSSRTAQKSARPRPSQPTQPPELAGAK